MGMNYSFFIDNISNEIDRSFPQGLGWFSERVGVFGENAEFKQLEKILNIDLKLINHLEFDFENDFIEIRTTVDEFETMIRNLIEKIEEKPNYHLEIEYQNHRSQTCEEYLKSGRILEDLRELLSMMKSLRKESVRKFIVSYN